MENKARIVSNWQIKSNAARRCDELVLLKLKYRTVWNLFDRYIRVIYISSIVEDTKLRASNICSHRGTPYSAYFNRVTVAS